MTWRAELYERYARACVQDARRIDSAEDRELLLKLARQWMQDANSEAEVSRGPSYS
jgi:hypothetical protein